MSIGSAIAVRFRATDLDTIRPSSLVTPERARYWTMKNNVANGVLYGLNTLVPLTGVTVNPLVGTVKAVVGTFIGISALGMENPLAASARLSLGADLVKSGVENVLVGVASLIPGYGQWITGAMSVRSFVDARLA